MDTSLPFSIVIVNYKSAARIGRLLTTLPHDGNFSVIVANNDPSEQRVLQKLSETTGFTLIETGANRGFAAGANIGALAAEGAIIGFINPDTLWNKADFQAIQAVFDTIPNAGIVGLRLTDQDGRTEPFSFGDAPSLRSLIRSNLFPFAQKYHQEKTILPVDWVSGGALFIKKNLFHKLGGFDEQFFLYFEDADLCLRARQTGTSILSAQHLPIIHLGGQSQESTSLQKQHFYASQSAYYRKHRPQGEYRLLRFFRFLRYGL